MRRSDTIVKYYVCALCWGPLVEKTRDGVMVVECARHGEDHDGAGYWTQWSANKARDRSRIQLMEVIEAYRLTPFAEELGIKKPAGTPQEILDRNKRLLGRDEGRLF